MLKITAAILSLTVQLFLPFSRNLTPNSEVCRFVTPNVLSTKRCQLIKQNAGHLQLVTTTAADRVMTQHPYTLQWASLKIAPSHGDLDPI